MAVLTIGVAAAFSASTPDFSKEAIVLEKLSSVIHYKSDGTSDATVTVVFDIQSDAAVRQFGVLAFSYAQATQRTELLFVRVRKKDGTVIETPVSSAMDVPSEVAKAAPMYSDTHEKQIPVKSLAVGDVLEYSVHTVLFKPEIEGQFWYAYNFSHDVVVRQETLDIYVPLSKFVKVVSPHYPPATTDDGVDRHYSWKFSHLEPTNADPKKQQKTEPQPIDVQLTTFHSWSEVGKWYSDLMATQTVVTPVIASKAAELTKGRTTPDDRARAIYDFVASKFRYISLSFGVGRYQPHKADEVLENAYGDCKDKHTLFTALLKAAGIRTATVLIGDGLTFDPEVPSPAQFNHVITALPEGQQVKWADTTSEVAPFGLLVRDIRDHKALQIDAGGESSIVTTPTEAPFPQMQSVSVDSSLDSTGVLTGHFDLTFHGDVELVFRALFRQIAPVQWTAALQNVSYALGFAGDISNPSVDNIDDLDKPLHISYDYKRTGYSDWDNHRISPPLPPISLPLTADAEKPIEPIKLAGLGEIRFKAVLRLPKQYTLEPPKDVTVADAYAEYHARYSIKDDVFTSERSLKTLKSSLPVSDWEVYKKLASAVSDDHGTMLQLVDASLAKEHNNPKAAESVENARQALVMGDLSSARARLDEAETIEPRQRDLWFLRSIVALMLDRSPSLAMEDLKHEMSVHPDNDRAAMQLASMQAGTRDRAAAIATLRELLKHVPHDGMALTLLSDLLERSGKPSDVTALLEAELDRFPDNVQLRNTMISALLQLDKTDQALSMAKEVASKTSDPFALNNLAYALAEHGVLDLARTSVERAIKELEAQLSNVSLDKLEESDLRKVDLLAAAWDTLGWVYFKGGDVVNAERYIEVSWDISQHGDVADHLGQIYAKKGDNASAIHMWQLALAAGTQNNDEVEKRLKFAGGSVGPQFTKTTNGKVTVAPAEELGRLRTYPLPTLELNRGSAEYYLLIAKSKVISTKLITGDADSPNTQAAVQTLTTIALPDAGPERIVRRGILSCSQYTKPKCEMVLLQSGATHKFNGVISNR